MAGVVIGAVTCVEDGEFALRSDARGPTVAEQVPGSVRPPDSTAVHPGTLLRGRRPPALGHSRGGTSMPSTASPPTAPAPAGVVVAGDGMDGLTAAAPGGPRPLAVAAPPVGVGGPTAVRP